jgi:hypothetical protein
MMRGCRQLDQRRLDGADRAAEASGVEHHAMGEIVVEIVLG